MIEYYSSSLNKDCFFAAIDDVIVAMFHEYTVDNIHHAFWMDRCVYRPVRNHNVKIQWNGIPYDPAILVNPIEFEMVRKTKLEWKSPERLQEIQNNLEKIQQWKDNCTK